MNPIWNTIIINTTLKDKQKKRDSTKLYSNYVIAKAYRILKINTIRGVKDFLLIGLGIFSAAFGFKGFLLTNQFIDGGATGISLLISALTKIPLYVLLIAVNVPFMIMGYRMIGKQFAIKTTLAILGLAIVVGTVPFPNVTNDNLLVAIFGGFFLGAGIGLAVRGGAVIDGTEVLAIFLSRKLGTTIGDIIVIINVFIFSAASYFLSLEIAMYSMITYLAASKTLDFIIEGIDEYTGVTIVATKSEEIREMIIQKMGRGVTVYLAKKGSQKMNETKSTNVIYTVVTRLELGKLNSEIQKIEPDAFVVMTPVKDTKGGLIKKRGLKH